MRRIQVQTEPFDLAAEQEALWRGNARVGALVSFVGLVRDLNEGVSHLTLEHYPGMTEKALTAIADEAAARWQLEGVTLIHRVGTLEPQDPIVFVGVVSPHRGDAFSACEFLIDSLKTRAPFWKKESTAAGERWVEARQSDETAAGRWSLPSCQILLNSQNVTSNAINVELIRFEVDQHLALLKEWLERSHVSRWWGDAERNLSASSHRSEYTHAIIAANSTPVGYLCWQTPSQAELREAGLADLPRDLIDVDIMIGELDAMGKGVGPKALKCLFERLKDQGVSRVGLAGAVANDRAMRAYEKAGLFPYRDFYEDGEEYRYFSIDLT